MEEPHVEQLPADGAVSASAEAEDHELTETAGSDTKPLTTRVDTSTAAPVRAQRRRRAVLVVMSILLLVASLSGSLYMGGGSIEGFLRAFTGPSPTAHATETDLPATPTATLPPPTATATAKATPRVVGDGVPPGGGGSWPPYTGSISAGQGCPNGHAPKPVGWAIQSASDYGAPRASVVALTFDDGPTPAYSPQIISYLEQTHTPATFFVLGQYAQAYPWLV
ncbi:MAG TPA: polysaccharide deacetylase family protein, partial [Ktedonobacterales bacterium]